MGASNDTFVKYPRTPHLFGSTGTDDDKHMGERSSIKFITDPSLIVEEKLDGTNVGIQFLNDGKLFLQCRGHQITGGMHPQFDPFKKFAYENEYLLWPILGKQYIMYGEWVYAKHSIHYRELPHYFFEFDIYDKDNKVFLSEEWRSILLEHSGILSVPIVHRGECTFKELEGLIGPSQFNSEFENPITHQKDNLMEGLYLRTENVVGGIVTGRAKFVRPEFTEKVKQSEHWQHQTMVPNLLKKD